MVTWGIVSDAMMFAHDATPFYVLRFLFGIAEAGFFPGVILFLTHSFPSKNRTQALGMFNFSLPLAQVFGSPLSGWLLEFHDLFGLKNWQLLFLVEGLLASLVGIAAYFYLVDQPGAASWFWMSCHRDTIKYRMKLRSSQWRRSMASSAIENHIMGMSAMTVSNEYPICRETIRSKNQ